MHGYAAFERVVIHGVGTASSRWLQGWPGLVGEPSDQAAVIDEDPSSARGSLEARLRDVLDDLRQTWSQTTFFMFDPHSWL